MTFDRTSILALMLGAALSLGTVACGNANNRAGDEARQDQPAASDSAAREGQQPRTDNPEDVDVDADVRTKGEGAGVSGSARVGDRKVGGKVDADVDAGRKQRNRDRNQERTPQPQP